VVRKVIGTAVRIWRRLFVRRACGRHDVHWARWKILIRVRVRVLPLVVGPVLLLLTLTLMPVRDTRREQRTVVLFEFQAALRKVTSSVSKSQRRRYEALRETFATGIGGREGKEHVV
jgi:hypothetical protein